MDRGQIYILSQIEQIVIQPFKLINNNNDKPTKRYKPFPPCHRCTTPYTNMFPNFSFRIHFRSVGCLGHVEILYSLRANLLFRCRLAPCLAWASSIFCLLSPQNNNIQQQQHNSIALRRLTSKIPNSECRFPLRLIAIRFSAYTLILSCHLIVRLSVSSPANDLHTEKVVVIVRVHGHMERSVT